MTLREVRDKATSRSSAHKRRVSCLVVVLLSAAELKNDRRCAVCGLLSTANTAHFAIPVNYIATCIVLNNLDEHVADLPLRTAFLCSKHETHFDALFVDVAELRWNLDGLERRAEVLQGVMVGSLLVFGGSKAVKVVQEFQAAVVALKESR